MKFFAVLAALAALAIGSPSLAYDSDRSFSEPGNALVAPFDVQEGVSSFMIVSNVGSEKLSTHWAFWSSNCDHVADVSICLTQQDTVVVDPNSVHSINEQNQAVGPTVSLAGKSGFVTVTAYAGDDDCKHTDRLVDDSLIGSFTIANTVTTAAFAGSPLVLGLDESGSYTNLPDMEIVEVNANTFAPSDLEQAVVYVLSLQENTGQEKGEVGPIDGTVSANVAYYDNMEVRISLPDLTFGCANVLDLLSFLEPLGGATSGMLQLRNIAVTTADGVKALGGNTAAFGVVGEAVGPFGVALPPSYKYTSLD